MKWSTHSFLSNQILSHCYRYIDCLLFGFRMLHTVHSSQLKAHIDFSILPISLCDECEFEAPEKCITQNGANAAWESAFLLLLVLKILFNWYFKTLPIAAQQWQQWQHRRRDRGWHKQANRWTGEQALKHVLRTQSNQTHRFTIKQ